MLPIANSLSAGSRMDHIPRVSVPYRTGTALTAGRIPVKSDLQPLHSFDSNMMVPFGAAPTRAFRVFIFS